MPRGKALECSVCCYEEEGLEKVAYCREGTGAPRWPLGEEMWQEGGEGAAAVSGAGAGPSGCVGGQRLVLRGRPRAPRWSRSVEPPGCGWGGGFRAWGRENCVVKRPLQDGHPILAASALIPRFPAADAALG